MQNVYQAEKSKKRITPALLIRFSGLFGAMAGVLFIAIQVVHPPDQLASVGTDSWVIVAALTSVMAIFNVLGITGIYAAQVKESGWPGLLGYLTFSLFWLATLVFSFIEALVLPVLTSSAPEFVEGFLGIFGGFASSVDLGYLPVLVPLAGAMYILGGLVLGVAIFRARVLPRFSGVLLAISAIATLTAAVIPHPFDRILAVPMGITLIWLGYILWSERKEKKN
ncbi:hypothetical protein [Planomicrobium sp. Y74]|uniref:hypothetical protein n=1 Tax=Planomicrobium sp. Y74 TaxID=2478977 RepID=UPI000EF55B33|nr:hypothetical protein [Planomicrobium sp. Y74]RLQ89702.1 hypothetical protein D9754_12935 [Planomicrobium sp. Y74]